KTASVRSVQVEVRVDRLVFHHERPILGVMVGVDDGEHRMVHVLLRAPADVLELEVDRLAVGRHLAGHTRPVPLVAIVNQRSVFSFSLLLSFCAAAEVSLATKFSSRQGSLATPFPKARSRYLVI